MKPPAIPPDASPAALARAIAILRAEGDHAAADFLQSHLPPAHGPLPHWDDSQFPNAGQQLPPPNGTDADGAGEGPFPDAGGLTESGVPGAPNAHSAGSLPPKIDKAYEWTRNPLAPSFPLTDTTAPDKPEPEPEHKFGCVLLPIPEPVRGRVLALGKMIPTADLAPDGRSDDIHATVLFGIHDTVAHADVFEVLSHFRPVRLRLGAVTVFENGEHDVIKIEVESDQIRRMNNALRHLPHTSKWSEYRPHITVAYVQPGLGAQYARQFGTLDAKCRCQSAVYSTSDGDKHVYPLGRLIRVEKAFDPNEARDEQGQWTSEGGIRLFHGTQHSAVPIQQFNDNHNKERAFSNGKRPWFFADDPQIARSYGRHVHEYDLDIRNPLDITEVAIWSKEGWSRDSVFIRSEDYDALPQWVQRASEQDGSRGETDTAEVFDYLREHDIPFADGRGTYSMYDDALKKFGSGDEDGIIARKTLDTLGQVETRGDIYIVFDGKQIRPSGPGDSRVNKAAMSYLNAGTGGALIGPPAVSRRKRIKLKRNRSALAMLCQKALEEVGSGFANSSSLTKQLTPDPEEFVFGTKAFDESHISREKTAHDTKRPGEFAPKSEGGAAPKKA